MYLSSLTDINDEEFWLTYNNRFKNNKNKIFKKIGQKLQDILKVIPNGKLILFPNYLMLEKCFDSWTTITEDY